MSVPPIAVRLARLVALALIIAIGLFNLYQAVTNWTLSDAEAYWNAGIRIREGAQLYPPLASVDASDVFRYAPWFAWAAVPVTYLDPVFAGVLWSGLLLAASALALLPLVRSRAWLLVTLFGPILVGISAVGNVHPLLIAALVHGVERRTGPLAIGFAASLKIFPLLLALVYAGRRQWLQLAAAVAFTVLLWIPALAYDLSAYATNPGQAAFLFAAPLLYLPVVGSAMIATLILARTKWAWLAGATTVALALPRFFVYDVTYLMLGAQPVRPPADYGP